ncbi:MAG: LicD family protein [Lachnospiraceae bacterium]|nr:LicD family protein [Lachnospiraceae bacterium]
MDVKKAQKINLLLLKEFDRFCRAHDIKYRLEAGTLLGAIRHKGFVPWDDDCDVVLTRENYEKLINCVKTDEFKAPFKFVRATDYKDAHFFDFVDRLFYVGEVYREGEKYRDRYDGYLKYLWLDIFVLDGVDEQNRNKNYFLLKVLYGLAMGHRYFINYKKYALGDKLKVFVLSAIGKLISCKYLVKKYFETVKKNCERTKGKTCSKYYYMNYPIVYIEYEVDKEDEKDIIYVDFEDAKLPVIKEYDKLLKVLYGNYEKLPEESKRVPEHIDII